MKRVYLDNNATTRALTAVKDAVTDVLGDGFGNPSSPTLEGGRALERLTTARDAVAALTGAEAHQIFFTSGCTEGNNTCLRLALDEPRRLITTGTEHASVSAVADWLEASGVTVVRLSATNGEVSAGQVRNALDQGASLVSIQWANSETGVLQPIADIARVCAQAGAPLHVDAAQAVGRIPIDLHDCPIDYLTFSGHKLHAPQGVGVTFARVPDKLPRMMIGGEQEGGRRAGTENLPGIAGLGAACEARAANLTGAVRHMASLRDRFEQSVLEMVPGAIVNGGDSPRVCNTSNIRFPVDGQALVAQLSGLGIVCSQTSACSSNSPEPSKVLTMIGLSRDEAFASVRFSFSCLNTTDDVDAAVDAIARICERLPRLV